MFCTKNRRALLIQFASLVILYFRKTRLYFCKTSNDEFFVCHISVRADCWHCRITSTSCHRGKHKCRSGCEEVRWGWVKRWGRRCSQCWRSNLQRCCKDKNHDEGEGNKRQYEERGKERRKRKKGNLEEKVSNPGLNRRPPLAGHAQMQCRIPTFVRLWPAHGPATVA